MTIKRKLKKGDVVLLKTPQEHGWFGTWKAAEVIYPPGDPECDTKYPDKFIGFPLTMGWRRNGWDRVFHQSTDPRCNGPLEWSFNRADVKLLPRHQPINGGI